MDVSVKDPAGLGPAAAAAAREIEKCVHCGFCNAACPTYAVERDERDGPRGRIYLVKELLEGGGDAAVAQRHLDRCLTCRSCEAACPSGVGYSKVAHAGRAMADGAHRRGPLQVAWRALAGEAVRSRAACAAGRAAVRAAGPLAPRGLRRALARTGQGGAPGAGRGRHRRSVSVMMGCGAQAGLMPETNRSLEALLDAAGYAARPVPSACCGALRSHLGFGRGAAADVRRTVEGCGRGIEAGDEAVMFAASGCASFATEYPSLAAGSGVDEKRAGEVAAKVRDPADFLSSRLDGVGWDGAGAGTTVATHAPCTLTNGLRSPQAYPRLLAGAGFGTVAPERPPNCCGSAGMYSLLQPRLADELGRRMAASVEATGAQALATANIGCALHLRRFLAVPVVHWIDLLASALPGGAGAPAR